MAIADDVSVAVNGDIRYTGTTANYTVLELHDFLRKLADDGQAVTTSNDYMDISFPTPSVKIYDTIINLNSPYNVDDNLVQHLYGGSITQDNGNTIYAGLAVVGSVNTAATQIQLIQDNKLYDGDSPFWGNQTTPYNGGGTTLFRILVKIKVNGFFIDGGRVRLRAGHWGDTFASFPVSLGVGESVGSITTTPDPKNTSLQATVQAWAGGDIPTNTEGYQLIDINDGNGDQPYYSQWTFNTNALGAQAIWEWGKDITSVGTSSTIHGIDGDLFRGITDLIPYTNETGGPFVENEVLAWGMDLLYNTLTGGTFTEGNYVVFGTSGAYGRINYDDGATYFVIALDETTTQVQNLETITEYSSVTGAATGVTAAVNQPIPSERTGGTGLLLALDDNGTSGNLFIQLQTGVQPTGNQIVIGQTSGATGDSGTVSAETVPSVFLGAYTGSWIGAFGIGIDPNDLSSGDTVQDLDGDTNSAPNNVTYSISGGVAGEDYLLVGKKDTGNDFDFAEMTLATTLNGATETQIDVGAGNIVADAPATGILRVTLDDGRHRRIAYTSHDTQYFTVASSDWTAPNNSTAGVGVMLALIDKLVTSDPETFTLKYNADRTLWQRARDGGDAGDNEPIVTWEQQGNLTNTGGSAIINRQSDA